MINPDSPFELAQALAQHGRIALLARLADRGHADIGMPDVKLLWCLGAEPISVQRAAEMIGTTKQFAARTVAKLQQAGLLQVAIDAGDKRALAISATKKGAALIRIVSRERDAIETEWREKIGETKLRRLTEGLAGLVS